MKTKVIAASLMAAALVGGVWAQMPATPAPPVPAEFDNSTNANAASADPASPLQPNQIVYAPRLPSPQELSDVARARGFTIARIEQSAADITVAYNLPGGQTSVVKYVLLTSAAAGPTVVVKPAPTVVYVPAPRTYYYDPFYYDPWYYYPPVALSFGFGFGHYGGWHGGGWHGGHGGWHGGHGGWHR